MTPLGSEIIGANVKDRDVDIDACGCGGLGIVYFSFLEIH